VGSGGGGRLGIKDLKKMNISLLMKWWWKLDNENGLCQDIVSSNILRTSHRHNNSTIWYDLPKVKDVRCIFTREEAICS
jgi:hypothetical protein